VRRVLGEACTKVAGASAARAGGGMYQGGWGECGACWGRHAPEGLRGRGVAAEGALVREAQPARGDVLAQLLQRQQKEIHHDAKRAGIERPCSLPIESTSIEAV
jgi:hypothetical protein